MPAPRTAALTLLLACLAGVGVGCLFDEESTVGVYCEIDDHCGAEQACIDNYCELRGGCSLPFEPCDELEDCCHYDGTFDVGASDCVWFTATPNDKFCADYCESHGDCDTHCCVAIDDTNTLGICLESESCG